MSEVNSKLKRSTYRGIQFFYRETSEEWGFKTAKHEYPGSDNVVIEQLGKKGRIFNINARVEFERRDAFDNALNTSGSGILSHPMYGNLIVKVGEYTKSDAVTDLGFYTYAIQFFVEIGLIIPTIESISVSAISNARAAVLENVVSFVNERVKVTF